MGKRAIVSFVALLLMAHATSASEFTTVGGGDLTDPGNWSDGLVPPFIVQQSGTLAFTLGTDVSTPISLNFRGQATDATIDLLDHTWSFATIGRSGPSTPFGADTSDEYTLSNGNLAGFFTFTNSAPTLTDLGTTFSDIQASTGTLVQVQGAAAHTTVVLGNQTSLGALLANGTGSVDVRVEGGSNLNGRATEIDSIDRTVNGDTAASLVVDGGSLSGTVIVDSNEYAEVTIRGGSTSSADTKLGVYAPQANVTIEGSDTHVVFNEMFSTPRDPELTDFANQSHIFTVADGALVEFTNNRAPVAAPLPAIMNLGSEDGYSHALVDLLVTGSGSTLEASDAPLFVGRVEVLDGGLLRNNQSTDVMGTVIVRNATVESDLRSAVPPTIARALFGEVGVILDHATAAGNINGFQRLELNAGVVEGNVGVLELAGAGQIVGTVSQINVPSNYGLEVDVNGLLEITGDLLDMEMLRQEIRSTDDFGQLRVHGVIDALADVVVNPMSDTSFRLPWELHFAEGFHASIGDRLELVQTYGLTFDIDAVLGHLPPPVQQSLLNSIPEAVNGLPQGYAFNVFIDEHAIGIEVTTVPEVSSMVMLAVAALPAGFVIVRRSRRMRNA